MACILGRQSSPIYGVLERTEPEGKKCAVEEDPLKSPEKNKKNEPSEQLKSTESLKIERPQNKPEKRTKYLKTALQIAKNETPQDRRVKNKPELKKLTSERIRALQTSQKTTPQENRWVEDGPGKEREKVTLRREKAVLHKRKQLY